MRAWEIPQLVFATRSPTPRTGSDFVRQVVAESAGVSEEARREFSRRADIAGSVLQFRPRDPDRRLRVFFFHPLSDGTWLFARAVSLGLYRKGSHQLLVHAMVLGEEVLDGLEANPLALDALDDGGELGSGFLDRHPGSDQDLAPLILKQAVFEHVHHHNRRRLAETPAADQDRWIAAAYEALAGGERAVCVTADPVPEAVERLLLHFHPDDRLEIGFSTFYSHSRQVDYRLLASLPEDLPQVRSQFRGIRTVDLAAPPPATGLGGLACELRRKSPPDFLYAVQQALLTHLSHRRRPPLSAANAALVLRAGLEPESLSSAERERLAILYQRATGGLAYLLAHLAASWVEDPEELRQALDAATRADDKITREQLDRYRDRQLDASSDAQRWALAALLTRSEALAADADPSDQELLKLWRRLLPRRMLDELAPRQMAVAGDVLCRWALVGARAGGPADDPPDWAVALRWLHDRQRLPATLAAEVEGTLAGRARDLTPHVWRGLGDLYRDLGRVDDARRVLLDRELPSLSASEAGARLALEVDRILDAGGGGLADLAPYLGRPGVAAALFGRLADQAASRPDADPWPELRRCLDRADRLDPAAAEAAGHLLAAVASSAAVDSGYGGWFLGRCRQLPPVRIRPTAFIAGALTAAAARLVPVCEAAGPATQTQRILTAVATVLEVRDSYSAASGADSELTRLAVRGRVLAAEARSDDENAAAARLDAAWRRFLRQLSRGPAFVDPAPAEVLEWLDLLQDEILAKPPGSLARDPSLALFLDLAGKLREREPGAAYGETLAFKLHWARRLARTVHPGAS